MGAITIEKANSLFWLGRYLERVYSTTLYYETLFDTMLDKDPNVYHEYTKKLDIPDIYENDAHFLMSYLYYLNNPDSIYSNLKKAYDNAIVLRDEISSEVLAYMQMAVNTFDTMEEEEAPILGLQDIIDHIYSFWGCLDEPVEEGAAKEIIKLGKYTERVDLYIRLDYTKKATKLAYTKLYNHLNQLKEVSSIKGLSSIEKNLEANRSSLFNNVIDITNCFNY